MFADLGFPDAEERQTKLRLAYALNTILDEQHLAQAAAATRLGLNQPKVSALRNYKLEGFSVERLMTLLNALDQDVEIVIRAKPRRARRHGSAWWRGRVVVEEGCGGGISEKSICTVISQNFLRCHLFFTICCCDGLFASAPAARSKRCHTSEYKSNSSRRADFFHGQIL